MKRKADRKGWTPERKARFQATLAKKKAVQNSHLQVNRLMKPATKVVDSINLTFIEHFVGIFKTANKVTQRKALIELVKRV